MLGSDGRAGCQGRHLAASRLGVIAVSWPLPKAVQQNDATIEERFGKLHEQYECIIYRFARNRAADNHWLDAGDYESAMRERLWLIAAHHRAEKIMPGYIKRALWNACTDCFRRCAVWATRERLMADIGVNEPVDGREAREQLRRCWQLLATLKPALRRALLLQAAGYRIREIAVLTNAPLGTVKFRVCFARKLLRGKLAAEEAEDN